MRERTMHISCTACPVRGRACDDCVVTALYAAPRQDADAPDAALILPLDARERRAVAAMVGAGLIDERAAARARAVREDLGLRRAQ